MLAAGRMGAQVAGDVAIEAVRLFEWQHPMGTVLAIVLVDAMLRRPAAALSCIAALLAWKIDAVMGYIRQLKTPRSGLEDAITLKSHGDTLLQVGRYLCAKYAAEMDFARRNIHWLEHLNMQYRGLLAMGLLATAPTGCTVSILSALILALLLKDTPLAAFYMSAFSALRLHLRAHEINNHARQNGECIMFCGHLRCQGPITVLGVEMEEIISHPKGEILTLCRGTVVPMGLLVSLRDELLKDFTVHIGEWKAFGSHADAQRMDPAHYEQGACRSWTWTRQYQANDPALIDALAMLLRYGLIA